MKTNKFAIYSIVCSAVSIFILWWLSLAGIGYGIKALKDIKETGKKGKILAIIGILLGIISITLFYGFKVGLL